MREICRVSLVRTTTTLLAVCIAAAAVGCGDDVDEGDTTEVASAPLTGQDLALVVPLAGVVLNQYAVLQNSVMSGATSFTVTNIADLASPLYGALAPGDLLMIIQMQGATIASGDNAGYGNVTALNNAGRHELVEVLSILGNTITFADTCATGTRFAYTAGAAGRTQVVRVPQLTSLTISGTGSVVAPAWDGLRGGVVALHVQGTTTVDGSIDVSGRGFRGGVIDNTTSDGVTTFRSGNTDNGAEKGESIAGDGARYASTFNGRYSRGAPANGGGGGDGHNGGGGGGANGSSGAAWTGQGVMDGTVLGAAAWALDPGYIANGNALTTSSGGGRGGYTFSGADQDATMVGPGQASWGGDLRREVGGLGGRPVVNDPGGARLFVGGGGGAGDGNNGASGAGGAGGGLIYLISGSVGGAGTLRADGNAGSASNGDPGDAPGGGGGGGTVVVRATTLTGVTIGAGGGAGGSQTLAAVLEAEGPGGGGGGGFIAVAAGTVTRTAAGAANGTTNRPVLAEFPSNGATRGAAGEPNARVGTIPMCMTADLSIAVTDGQLTDVAGTSTTYTITVTNTNDDPVPVIGAAVADSFPASLTGVTWTCTATAGSSCAAASGVGNIATTVDLAPGGIATFTVSATISPAATGVVSNTATVTAPAGVSDAAQANNTATDTTQLSSEAELAIVLSDNPDPVLPGGSLTYTMAVTNNGPSAATGVSVAITVPVGAAVTGAGGTGWACSQAGQVVTCTRAASLGVGAAPALTVTVNAPAAIGSVSATATVSASTADPTPANNSDTETTQVGTANSPPDAVDDAFTVLEDAAATVLAVLTNDTTEVGETLTVIAVTQPASGTVTLVGGVVSFQPAADFNGTTTFAYTVSDGNGGTDTATVTMTVTSVNDVPVAVDDTATVPEDGNVIIAVLGNDTGLGDRPVTVTIASPPASGTATPNGNGTITYVPAANATGVVTFTYTVTDLDGQSATATVTVTITPVDDDPIAIDDTAFTPTSTAVVIDVLANDVEVDGDPLSVVAVTQPVSGAVVITGGNSVTYTPVVGFQGTVTFTYTISDGAGATDTATVTVTVGQDSDGDGLIDAEETILLTDPLDDDSDDDGVHDGEEVLTHGTDPLDPDSDDDGLFDGTELGLTTPQLDDTDLGVFVPDGDPATMTDPNDADSDDDGIIDGDEDADHDGEVDDGEPDPNDPDSDDDGLFDGTEVGVTSPDADTDVDVGTYVPDADPTTTTDPTDPDTDDGGVSDGDEDTDGDGQVDDGERDPLEPGDDQPEDDRDDDGVPDALDVCPDDADADQLDTDGDGDGDACDPDADGDGFADDLGLSGGGCAAGGGGGGWLAALVLALVLAGRRRRAAALAIVPLLVLGGGDARAQEAEERAAFPVERHRIAMDPEGVIGAESGAVPEHGRWEGGLWLGLSDDPLVVYRMDEGDRIGSLVHRRVGGSLHASLALWGRLELNIESALVLYQTRDATIDDGMTELPELERLGLGDLRFAVKLQLLRAAKHGVDLAVIPTINVPVGGGHDYLREDALGFAPELAVSRRFGAVRLAGNVGYRTRPAMTVVNLVVDDELFARLGVAYRFTDADPAAVPLELALSLGGATGAADALGDFNRNALEVQGQVSYDLSGPLLAFAGGGLGLNEGFGTPDWRVMAGMRFAREPARDPDRDGLFAPEDRCPLVPEDRDDFEDADGCDDPDNDRDQVLDGDDGAPLDPEDRDDFEDADGVPDLDDDADGVLDVDDGCRLDPETANGYQDEDGCPDVGDLDGDGMTDDVDGCPEEAEDVDSFMDDDGCPDPDNDGDGVFDVDDGCVLEPGPAENRGCPDTDRDGDDVVDRLDNCPDERGKAKNQGCKDKQLVVITEAGLDILDIVYFDTNKARIQKRSFKLLDQVAAVMISHSEIGRFQVEGHTDDRGNDAFNLGLSQRRADAVVTYLVAHGVEAERLTALGVGENEPIAPNKTKKGRATNRRVVFKIVGPADGVEVHRSGPTGPIKDTDDGLE